ncbi:MAG: fibrinogen-like YCDxxxxGGGW domain-containing protein [Polyangiaceae bacterium]
MKRAHGLSLFFTSAIVGVLACDRVVELPIAGCDTGTQDGTETDVDCGGSCATKCADGKHCAVGADCVSQVCAGGVCQVATCTDTVQNGVESAVDCGGTTCPKCADGKTCRSGADCTSGVCVNGTCAPASCADTVKNATESDVDCGGACVPAARCDNGKTCNVAADCKSGVCTGGVCQVPSCSDAVKNGSEGDVDCGATCSVKCNDGQTCNVAGDCKSGVCTGGKCIPATCSDGVKNGTEGDVDCGAACPTFCDDGKTCAPGDCKSGVCTNGVCIPSQCTDGVKNGTESDKDCGGTCPVKCDDGKVCNASPDCKSQVCQGKRVRRRAAPTASRTAARDKDCGAACPSKCIDGKTCGGPADCVSGVCTGGICQVPSCTDTVQNGSESDTDCGASCPTQCINGKKCGTDNDCASARCASLVCAACTQQSDCGASRDCVGGACVAPPVSCAAAHTAAPGDGDGVHLIDPDGAGGHAPLKVFCDMTTAGGGWTALPLLFADTSLWDISLSGSSCVTITVAPTNTGHVRSELTSSFVGDNHTYTNNRFKLPIAVSSVWMHALNHRTGGASNTMDLTKVGPGPTSTDEGWWISNGTIPVGTNPSVSASLWPDCAQPGYVDHTTYCNQGAGDANPGGAFQLLERTVTLAASAPQFHMVADEACASALYANGAGEQLEIDTAADGDGIWRKGIFVR